MSYQIIIKKKNSKYDPKDLFLDEYNYSVSSENEEETTKNEKSAVNEESTDLSDMPPLEGDE